MKFLLVLSLVFGLQMASAAAPACFSLFKLTPFEKQVLTEDDKALLYNSAEDQKNSTTGARGENKWTLHVTTVHELIQKLGADLAEVGLKLTLRDKIFEGKYNITTTIYLNLFKTEDNLTDKIRRRKYALADKSKPVTKENIEYIELTESHSFLEFKMDIPGEGKYNAVYKPRALVADKYLDMIGTSEFLKNFNEILQDTIRINLEKGLATENTVRAMLKFLQALHLKKYSLQPLIETIYERFSYSIQFTMYEPMTMQYNDPLTGKIVTSTVIDADTGRPKMVARTFDVQITIDQKISGRNIETGATYQVYRDGVAVVEAKNQIEILKKSKTYLKKNFRGYSIYLDFIDNVDKNHLVEEYDKDTGKMGHFKREDAKPK